METNRFGRPIDFTTVNKSLTWEEWFQVNRDLVDHRLIYRKTRVVPKMGGFWVLNEFHEYNYVDATCISCGKIYGAHYEEECFCWMCHVNFEAEFFYYCQEEQKAWLIETYGSVYGSINKQIKKEPRQMTLF